MKKRRKSKRKESYFYLERAMEYEPLCFFFVTIDQTDCLKSPKKKPCKTIKEEVGMLKIQKSNVSEWIIEWT